MTKLIGTELIGFTVTNGKITGRVADYDDGVYYVSTRDIKELVEFTRNQITLVYFGGN